MEEDKVFKVLAGLDQEYDNLRSQILMLYPLLPLNTICSIIQHEETRHKVMAGDAVNQKSMKEEEKPEKLAFLMKGSSKQSLLEGTSRRVVTLAKGRSRLHCTYYRK